MHPDTAACIPISAMNPGDSTRIPPPTAPAAISKPMIKQITINEIGDISTCESKLFKPW